MKAFKVNEQVKLLLIQQSNEKERIIYTADSASVQVPKIGIRPPYYCNPRHEWFYPVM